MYHSYTVIFLHPLGGGKDPLNCETTPPCMTQVKKFIIFNVMQCKFALRASLHTPKHLSIPPQFQIPRNNAARTTPYTPAAH